MKTLYGLHKGLTIDLSADRHKVHWQESTNLPTQRSLVDSLLHIETVTVRQNEKAGGGLAGVLS